MDFVSVILLLSFYYLRPQEWIGALNKLHPVQLVTGLAVWSLISRDQKLTLKDFFRTPHDWIIAAYFAWTTFASPTPWITFKAISSVILIYFVTVQGLTNLTRMRTLMAWWAGLIFLIALLAVASEYGFDPFGSNDITHGRMKDRLVLNLSIYNNPNGLAHSIVPVIPMLFFLLFWRRTVMKAYLIVLLIPLWCIYLTLSKGAFLCAGCVILATLCFGRPKLVQVVIIIFAMGFGWAALYQLPRMNELNKTKQDAAIQGRIAAYKFGLQCMRAYTYGIGLGNFVNEFFRHGPLEYPEHPKKIHHISGGHETIQTIFQGHHYRKATHGSYNQNGAELGRIGLFLFVGSLYCCLRTVLTAKTTTDEEERLRRILFCIILSYAVSSWMVDFTYRPTFFVFVAAAGAFHRHLRGLLPWQRKLTEVVEAPLPWTQRAPVLTPALATAGSAIEPRPIRSKFEEAVEPDATGDALVKINWSRIGLVDIGLMICATWAVIQYWEHLIKEF